MSTRFISYSSLSTLGMCPRKFVLSKRYEPKVKSKDLALGDVFHKVLAAFYSKKREEDGASVFNAAFRDYIDQAKRNGLDTYALEGAFTSLESILLAYWNKVASHDVDRFEFIAIEKPFEVRLSRDLVLHGFVDGIWQDRDSGVKYIVEHKYKSDHYSDLIELDFQVSLYTLALAPEYGILPTIYNVARKPAHKRISGEPLSSFVERVVKAIYDKLDDFEYKHTNFNSRYFIRDVYSRGRRELEVALEQARYMAKAMRNFLKNPNTAWRNVGEHCMYMCPFRSICIEEDRILVEKFFSCKEGAVSNG